VRIFITILCSLAILTSSAMAQQFKGLENERLGFASQLMSQAQFEQAAMIYVDFIEKYPQSTFLPDAYLGAGDSHFFLKEYDKALGFYEKYESLFPSGKDKWLVNLRQGQCWFLKGKGKEALAKLTAVDPNAVTKPFLQTLYFYLGQAYMDQKKTQEAAASFAKAVEVQTSGGYTSQSYLQWAGLLANQGDANGAFEKYSKAMEVGDSEELKIQLEMKQGLSYLREQNYDMASIIFSRIVDGYPAMPVGKNAALNLFIVMIKTGQIDKMLREYRDRFSTDFEDPLVVPIHLLAVETLVNRKEYEEAQAILDNLMGSANLSQNAKNDALFQKVRILEEQGHHQEALGLIEGQNDVGQDRKLSFGLLKGQSFIGQKNFDKAWEVYSQMAKDFPDGPDAYCGMGDVRYAQGQFDQAANFYMECFNKSKDDVSRQDALYNVFLVYAKGGMDDKAMEAAKNYQNKFPQGAHVGEITLSLAETFSKNKQYDKAIELLKNLPKTASYQDQREALFQVAYNLQLAGRLDEALALYKVIISQNTDTELTVMALKNSAMIAAEKNDNEMAAEALYLIVTNFPSNDLPTKDYLWLIEHWEHKKDVQKMAQVMEALQERPDFNPQSPVIVRAKEMMGKLK
jgi:tetratricopeptide (TPR) repeat protein